MLEDREREERKSLVQSEADWKWMRPGNEGCVAPGCVGSSGS